MWKLEKQRIFLICVSDTQTVSNIYEQRFVLNIRNINPGLDHFHKRSCILLNLQEIYDTEHMSDSEFPGPCWVNGTS